MSYTYHVFIGTVKINYKQTQVLDIEILAVGWELRSASSRVELTGISPQVDTGMAFYDARGHGKKMTWD